MKMALYSPLLSRDTLAGHSGGHPTGLVELAVRVSWDQLYQIHNVLGDTKNNLQQLV